MSPRDEAPAPAGASRTSTGGTNAPTFSIRFDGDRLADLTAGWLPVEDGYAAEKLGYLAVRPEYLRLIERATVRPGEDHPAYARWHDGHYLPLHDCPECIELRRRRPQRRRRAA